MKLFDAYGTTYKPFTCIFALHWYGFLGITPHSYIAGKFIEALVISSHIFSSHRIHVSNIFTAHMDIQQLMQ